MVIVSLYIYNNITFVIALPTVTEYMIYYLTVTTKCPVLNRKKKKKKNVKLIILNMITPYHLITYISSTFI